ncbi:MAG TPA: EAL domain-containing protein [Longimicrobiales bacterium]|nr:EAL domain-containing protein [Longimicrobiales bacterium]
MTESDEESAELSARAAAQSAALDAARRSFVTARAQEGRMAFLARASMVLGTTLDTTDTLDSIVRTAVPDLADLCIIDLVGDGEFLRRAALAHGDSGLETRLRRLLDQRQLAPDGPQSIALRTEQAQIGSADDKHPLPWPDDTEEGRLLRVCGIRSWLVLPLRSRGLTLGILSMLSSRRRSYAADEFSTAGEYVRRASVALDNALLYETALRARSVAEAAQEQFQALVNGLRESEDRYRTLFEESRDAIYMTRRDGQFIDANPAALELFGYTRQELLRQNARLLYTDPTDRERFRSHIEEHGFVRDFELMLRRKNGELLHCLLSSMVSRGRDGEIAGYQGIIHDITERKVAEARLMESEHFTRTIISSVQEGVIVYDRDLRYVVWNRFMEEITGLPAAQVIGTHMLERLPHLVEQGVDRLILRALDGETVHAPDIEFHMPDTGRRGWVSSVYSPHVSLGGEVIGVVGIIHDITERKAAEDQLIHNAFHDALTGLPNRALFVDRLERLMRHAERHPEYIFGVAFLDLDRFKVVNDSLGHLVGDQLLVAIGQRLERCVRQGDTVARLGGDEFAVLLDDVDEARDATRVAERILMELSLPFHLAGHDVFTTASIGIALSSTGYDRASDILRDADTAMYRAKTGGRSRYEVFDRNMHDMAVHTLQVETDLRRALERREFCLHYQPIIDLASGRIHGFEALIRWQHPRRGMVAPDDFVPLAEETGLIVGIGWWVLEEAARQMQQWLVRFPDRVGMTMSVNMSTKQFMQPDLIEQVDTALSRSGLPPRALKLEITESAVVQHEEAVTSALVALRARGIQLCIDDFGTGYSSLSYLHSFPVDTLKIDRSFISQIGSSGSPRLVETIVALSRNLGMESVAEGVETEEQLAFLRRVGPHYAQGFLFSRALPPAEIEQMLEDDPVW